MSFSVEWENSMKDNDYKSVFEKAVDGALRTAGIIIERQAANLAPVDTGRLLGSITWRTQRRGSQRVTKDSVSKPGDQWTLHVGTNVEYAPHIEYGTVRMKSQPFMRPALMAHKNDILRDFGKWVAKFLKRGK